MRCWKFAQKLFLSSEGFYSNNLEYISISISPSMDVSSAQYKWWTDVLACSPVISYRYQARKQGRVMAARQAERSGSTSASSVVRPLRFPRHFIPHLQQYY